MGELDNVDPEVLEKFHSTLNTAIEAVGEFNKRFSEDDQIEFTAMLIDHNARLKEENEQLKSENLNLEKVIDKFRCENDIRCPICQCKGGHYETYNGIDACPVAAKVGYTRG